MKDLYQRSELWKPVFGEYVKNQDDDEAPLYSIFRQPLKVKSNNLLRKLVPHPGEDIGLHILFLNSEGCKYDRNTWANQLEVQCSTCFYGPLVVVYGEMVAPYRLYSFNVNYL